jgi:hypothetical protein
MASDAKPIQVRGDSAEGFVDLGVLLSVPIA